jgi:hypothetical protein
MRRKTLSSEQKKFFKPKTQEAFKEYPYLKKLNSRLLKIGGIAVVLWNGTNSKEIVDQLLDSGEAAPGQKAVLQLGKVSGCHENSAALHQKDPVRYEVRTGYALSEDGIWRPHSWVVDAENNDIIETTKNRTMYFGVVELARQIP